MYQNLYILYSYPIENIQDMAKHLNYRFYFELYTQMISLCEV